MSRPEIPLLGPAQSLDEFSRRRFLAISGSAAGALAVPSDLGWLAENAGAFLDMLASPENIVTQPIVALEAREDNRPLVSPRPHGEPTGIRTTYARDTDTSTALHLDRTVPLRAEYTNTPIAADSVFRSAGTAIITTAEGLVDGEQAYCALFQSDDRTIAVGYQGGLYTYEPAIRQNGDGSKGEWVRIVTRQETDQADSAVTTTTPWSELESTEPDQMLVQKVVAGTNALRNLGYRPWGAVLPSTQMPDMKNLDLGPDICAKNLAEAISGEKSHLVTERGDIIDLDHLRAKAGETLTLFAQLYYQHIAGTPKPVANVKYSAGSGSVFSFAVSPDSLRPETLIDTTFSIMNAETMLMEGVAQQYAAEIMPPMSKMFARNSRMSGEDMFANSLGITGMLALIQRYGLADRIDGSLRKIHQRTSGSSIKGAQGAIDTAIQGVRAQMIELVLTRTARTLGVRPLKESVIATMPRGVYSLIPPKIANADAATPSRVDLRQAGVRPDNPNVRFTTTHVPAIQPTVERILQELGI